MFAAYFPRLLAWQSNGHIEHIGPVAPAEHVGARFYRHLPPLHHAVHHREHGRPRHFQPRQVSVLLHGHISALAVPAVATLPQQALRDTRTAEVAFAGWSGA